MKTIFEEGDIVRRTLFVKTGDTPTGMKGDAIGCFIGVLTDKPHIYKDCAIITYLGEEVYGRYFELVDTGDDGLNLPWKEGSKLKGKLILCDEDKPTIQELCDYKEVMLDKKDGELAFSFKPDAYQKPNGWPEAQYIMECLKGAGELEVQEFVSDSILKVGVATNGHQYKNGGRGTYTHIRLTNEACFGMAVRVHKDESGMVKTLDIFAEGDSELDQLRDAAKWIYDVLTEKTSKK